jgi:hypothetical protein
MKFRIALAAAALSAIAGATSAETLLLNCQFTNAANANPDEWFAQPPTDRNERAMMLMRSGVIGFATRPPSTWEITLPSGAIRDPSDDTPFWPTAVVKPASILGYVRSESGSQIYFRFNRITNTVKVERWLDDSGRKEWQAKHGKPFPMFIIYEQQCTVKTV